MTRLSFPVLPPRLLWLQLATCALLHWGLGISLAAPRSQVAGSVGLALGIGVNLWASRIFETGHTPIRPDETPRTLVERGPFRWSRNPMYLGLVALHLGVALLVGDALFWVSAVIHATILRVVFVSHEERVMRDAFGEGYLAYSSRVSRWIGRRL